MTARLQNNFLPRTKARYNNPTIHVMLHKHDIVAVGQFNSSASWFVYKMSVTVIGAGFDATFITGT